MITDSFFEKVLVSSRRSHQVVIKIHQVMMDGLGVGTGALGAHGRRRLKCIWESQEDFRENDICLDC